MESEVGRDMCVPEAREGGGIKGPGTTWPDSEVGEGQL